MKFRTIGKLLLGSAATASIYDCFTPEKILIRNLNTLRCGFWILWNYKVKFDAGNFMEIHEITAKDIYETCLYNDGLYVKFGQGMAASDHVLPPPFFKWMSKLQDKAKSCTYEVVRKVFQEEEGRSIEEAFSYFDPEPVASASIAQVHKARLHDGTNVAVKIQKPNIRRQFGYDMAMHSFILWVLEKAFDLPLLQFAEPVQRNLKKEVDFVIEAENTKLADEGFRNLGRDDVCVPHIYDEFTRKRVLVTEWIDGIKITDESQVARFGFNKDEIVQDMVRAFAQQIFITGFVHCDPHPGNIFVRRHPTNPSKPQIVILDHGLCIPVRQSFRKEYSEFWKAMFLRDVDKMRDICTNWGIRYKESFASSQMLRPYSENKNIYQKISDNDVMKMQSKMKSDIKDIMLSDRGFPEELIFLGRNMNLIRSINKFYGSKIDRVSIMVDTAMRGALTPDSKKPRVQVSLSWLEMLRFKLTVYFIRLYNWYLGFKGTSLDEAIDDKSVEEMNRRMAEYGFKPTDKTTFDA